MDAPAPDAMGGDTEEIDITDLVNMTKSLKKDIEGNQNDHSQVLTKMDDVFTKLDDLSQKLTQMDQVMAKIDQLGTQVQQMKPKTEVEKLEMRSLDSYPFNQKPQEFFANKQSEMRASGKNEYILTKDEVQDYTPETLRDTFNQTDEEDDFRF
jgi:outer membrane murein-binding lipoprotein Lpp